MRFFDEIWECMNCSNLEQKFDKFNQIYRNFQSDDINFNSDILPLKEPSYAKFCNVKSMKDIKQNRTNEAFLHSIAHIEYSAIDIALDSCYRFRNLPMKYYNDWLEVASDEIRHFNMIVQKMDILGVKYGDYAVHDGLFIALLKTQDSLINRMAILPRYMEANGLDANLFMMQKLNLNGDKDGILDILRVIHQEEISHVSKGDKWFKFACEANGVDPNSWIDIVRECYPRAFEAKRALDIEHRLLAGFSKDELDRIQKFQERV
ncbi:ferritin-like domain-containing protein [Campylobacter sp. CX2-8023-23]|uniref:Ferritin-like domain-containing protein n=1 Tax=Campylobacter porcelli TaxID=1660073 RepID=A0ABU7M398_9BACT|nr:ferritin-like domain-containing protein [Campylobacter sp. CX2-8023-23]MEE3743900.1 ferritin-like domain-containing protein [Campylobacter sp. CX2-4855-23]